MRSIPAIRKTTYKIYLLVELDLAMPVIYHYLWHWNNSLSQYIQPPCAITCIMIPGIPAQVESYDKEKYTIGYHMPSKQSIH